MAFKKIIFITLFVFLYGCSTKQYSYCVYEQSPFKIEVKINSRLNKIYDLDVRTAVNLDEIGFDEIETQAYIDDFNRSHSNKNNLALSLEENYLVLYESYDFKKIGLENDKYYAHDLTFREFETQGFTCN